MLTVILTGGGSRRMGRDKAMLPWNDTTMSQSLINKYSSVFGCTAVSVNKAGRFRFENAIELPDLYPDMGPMNGIVSAFKLTDADEIFLTATDLPFGEPALVTKLLELMGNAEACVIKRGAKGVEPLFAIYRRSCLEAAVECLERGRRSLKTMLEMIDVRYVSEDELRGFELERILANINTMEEYKKLI